MDLNKIAEFQNSRIQLRQLEVDIKSKFEEMARSEELIVDRTDDHGERGFVVEFSYDGINLNSLSLDNIESLKKMVLEHKRLKKLQRTLERQVKEQEIHEFTTPERIS